MDAFIQLYTSLFRGRTDVYPRRWEKDGKSGWSPAYAFDWNEFNTHRAHGGTIKDFENKTLASLTDEVLLKHLNGTDTIGIYPILPDNTSYFIVADFDESSWKKDIKKLVDMCTAYKLHAYSEISRSGNGGHVWIFFEDIYPCWKSRKILLELIRKSQSHSVFTPEASFDRLFPNQDTLSGSGFGNLICLPLQGTRVKNNCTVFYDPEKNTIYGDQQKFLKIVHKHTNVELDAVYKKLFDTKVTDNKFKNFI